MKWKKAHPEVHDLFLQIFSEGRLTSARGRTVNAGEAYFIMTSNTGSDLLARTRPAIGFMDNPGAAALRADLKKELEKNFQNRIH